MAQATLKQGPKLPTARDGHAAVRLPDGRVLIMGGILPFTGTCAMACTVPPTASVEILDPKSGKFSHNGSMAVPRESPIALLLDDGRVLVTAGRYGDSTVEIYDPARKTSVVVKPPADIPRMPVDSSVVLLADGRVLIAGGFWDDDYLATDLTFILDPASGTLSKGPTLAESRQEATATLLHDGRVLLVGGASFANSVGSNRNDAELIDPSQPMVKARLLDSQNAATSALLSDQRVLVAGGWIAGDPADCLPVTPQVFDPETEKFTPVSPMNTPRIGSTAIRIEDGRVLFLGGMTAECRVAATVEAFDPDSGTFQVISTGLPALSDYSATLLEDGSIFIAGGVDDNGMTATTWFLEP